MGRRNHKAKPAPATPAKAVPQPPNRRLAVLGTVAFGLLGLAALWWAHPDGATDQGPTTSPRLPPAADPRLTTASRFLNVRPDVRYVGDEACAGCHRALTAGYRE